MTEQKREEWRWLAEKSDLYPGRPPGAFLAPTVRWDANYYLSLARAGYPPPHPDHAPDFHAAFFPLYPLAVRGLTWIVGDTFWAAFLLSNACALLAALVMLRLGSIGAQPRDGLRASLLLLASPGAHFFSYPYPEALFVLLLSLSLLAIAVDRPMLAAVTGALASGVRSAGVVVAVCLLVMAWKRRKEVPAATVRALSATAALGGVVGFAVFCSAHFHDPFAFVHIQRYWHRSISIAGPVLALTTFTVDPDYFLITAGAILVCVWMVSRTPAWMSAGAWFLVLLPMATGTLKSMIRFQAANVPLFAGAGRLLRGRPFAVLLSASLLLMAFEAFLFGKGIGHY
jgi:hypothetical protein